MTPQGSLATVLLEKKGLKKFSSNYENIYCFILIEIINVWVCFNVKLKKSVSFITFFKHFSFYF